MHREDDMATEPHCCLMCKLLCAFALVTFVAPVALLSVLALLLEHKGHSSTITAFFYALQSLLALLHSEKAATLSLGCPPPRWFLLAAFLSLMGILAMDAMMVQDDKVAVRITLFSASICGSLWLPLVARVVAVCQSKLDAWPVLMYLCLMTWGGTPTALSATLYWLVVVNEPDLLILVFSVVAWIVAPALVRPFGTYLISQGSPKAKLAAPSLWVLYCEVCFATLGLPLFVMKPHSSMLYALSMAVVLGFHALRGCHLCQRSTCSADLRAERLAIFFDAFAVVIGRTVAYSIYFFMVVYSRVSSGNLSQHNSQSCFVKPTRDVALQIYSCNNSAKMSTLVLLFAIVGLIFIWFSYFLFCISLPYTWSSTAGHVVLPVSESIHSWTFGNSQVKEFNSSDNTSTRSSSSAGLEAVANFKAVEEGAKLKAEIERLDLEKKAKEIDIVLQQLQSELPGSVEKEQAGFAAEVKANRTDAGINSEGKMRETWSTDSTWSCRGPQHGNVKDYLILYTFVRRYASNIICLLAFQVALTITAVHLSQNVPCLIRPSLCEHD